MSLLSLSAPVAEALAQGAPVVALESTIITHGMPWPRNLEMAREVEDTINSLQTENEPGGGEEGQGQAQMAQLAQQLQQAHEQIQELSAKADDTQAKAAEASKKLEIEQQRVNAEIALNEQVAVRELELKERLTEAKIILDGQKAARVSAGPVN